MQLSNLFIAQLINVSTVQVSDTTGDAISTNARHKKYFIKSNNNQVK